MDCRIKQTMRVMFAVGSYWPSQDGVANITEYLAEGLAKRGHEVLVFTSAGKGGLQELPAKETYAKVAIERMRVYVQWPLKLQGRDDESTQQKYIERIKTYKPDVLVVVCSQTWPLDWILPYLDKLSCAKVFYSHGYSRWKEKYAIKEELLKRNIVGAYIEWKVKKYYQALHRYLRKFDLAIYLSELNNSYIYSEKYQLTNGKVLENAVEDIFVSSKMQHHVDTKALGLQFLYVANYNNNKNQDMLLKAFCEAQIENCKLIFTGFEENEYLDMLREHLKEWLPESSSNQVEFCVHLPREKVYELYKDCDVFVSASRLENCPIVHCEAAATGMAVITTDVGNVRQMDGVLLVNGMAEMKHALEMLYTDRNELAERGRRLREYMLSRKCRIEDKVDWLEAELQSLVSRG